MTLGGSPHFGRRTRIKLVGGELIANVPLPGDPGAWYDEDMQRTVDLRAALEGLKRRAHDLTTPFAAFREIWFALTAELFASEGAVEGAQPWPELSPAYARRKAARYGDMPILQRTRVLIESLLGGPGNVYEAKPRSLTYGSRVVHFEIHMTGADTGMPARPPIVLTRAAFGTLNRMVMSHIAGREMRG